MISHETIYRHVWRDKSTGGILKEEQDPRLIGNAVTIDTYKYLGNRRKKAYAEWEARQKGQPLPETPKKKGKKAADE